jgi:hypothetical protein
LSFEIGALHTFESEERVIERTIEVVFSNVSADQRATFVERAPENCVTANPNARTAR